MLQQISNVKISVVLHSSVSINHFITVAESRNVAYSLKRHFLEIKDVVSITIFKKSVNRYHLNITGIKSLEQVSSQLDCLRDSYCPSNAFELKSYKIDNLNATFNLGYSISLDQVASQFSMCNYNIERFPGLHIKSGKASIILFSNGKLNVLGRNSEAEIIEPWVSIQKKLKSVAKMRKI